MKSDELNSIICFQTGLFCALAGALVGRGVTTRHELTVAINFMSDSETDPLARELLRVTAKMMAAREPTSTEIQLALRVIDGGLGQEDM